MNDQPGATVVTMNAEPATDLSANASRGLIIVVDADGFAVVAGASGTGTDFVGALLDGGRVAGDPVSIVALGSALVVAGAALNEGEYLGTEAGGRVVTVAAANEMICAQALGAVADLTAVWCLMIRAQSVDGKP